MPQRRGFRTARVYRGLALICARVCSCSRYSPAARFMATSKAKSPSKSGKSPAVPPKVWTPPHIPMWGVLVVFLLSLAPLVAHQALNQKPTPSDEAAHLYVVEQVARGATLYKDIDSARPPLALLTPLVFRSLGLPLLTSGRLAHALPFLFSALILFFTARKLWSTFAGVVAVFLFLLSPDVIAIWTFCGMPQTSMFVLLTVCLVALGQYRAAGVAGACAMLTGQHAAVIVGLATVFVATHGLKPFARFALGGIATAALVIATVYALGGVNFYEDLIGRHLFHLSETKSFSGIDARYNGWLIDQTWALVPAAVAVGLALVASEPFKGRVADFLALVRAPLTMFLVTGVAHLFFVYRTKTGNVMYISPGLAPLVAVAAYGAHLLVTRFRSQGVIAGVLGLWLLTTAFAWKVSEERASKDENRDYPYTPHARTFVVSQLQEWTNLDQIAAAVKADSTSDATMFGSHMFAPWLALRSGRHITAGLADFAPNWLLLGLVPREELIRKLENGRITYFVSAPNFYSKDPMFSAYLKGCYRATRALTFKQLTDRNAKGARVSTLQLLKHVPEWPCKNAPI